MDDESISNTFYNDVGDIIREYKIMASVMWNWTDIVEISAGQHHVIGKRSDGTYVSAGSNGYSQCDVA